MSIEPTDQEKDDLAKAAGVFLRPIASEYPDVPIQALAEALQAGIKYAHYLDGLLPIEQTPELLKAER